MPCYQRFDFRDWVVVYRTEDQPPLFGKGEYVRAFRNRSSGRYKHHGFATINLYAALCHGRGNEIWLGDACGGHAFEADEKNDFMCGVLWRAVKPKGLAAVAVMTFAKWCSLRSGPEEMELLKVAIHHFAHYGENNGSIRKAKEAIELAADFLYPESALVCRTFARTLAFNAQSMGPITIADYAEFFRSMESIDEMKSFVASQRAVLLGEEKNTNVIHEAIVQMVRALEGQPLMTVPPASTTASLRA